MARLFKNKKLKIVAATLMVLFSLFTCFEGMLAWIQTTNNKLVDDSQFDIEYDPTNISFRYSIYKYDFDLKEGLRYDESESLDLSLNNFDSFIRERNEHNNIVFKLEVSFASLFSESEMRKFNTNISCKESISGETFVSNFDDSVRRTHNDGNGYEYINQSDKKTYVCNNFSNVVAFKSFVESYSIGGISYYVDDTNKVDTTTDATVYESATNKFEGISEVTSFVNGGRKSSFVNLLSTGIPGNAESIVIYIEYNYRESLVDDFIANSEFKGRTDIEFIENEDVVFLKDISLITFATEEDKQ